MKVVSHEQELFSPDAQVKFTCNRRPSRSDRRARSAASTPSDDDVLTLALADAFAVAEYECVREGGCAGGGVPGESRPRSKRLRDESGDRAEAKPTYRCRAAEAFLDADETNDAERSGTTLDAAFAGDKIADGRS